MSRHPDRFFALFAVVLLAVLSKTALAFNVSGERWRNGDVAMHLQLGSPTTPLLDGATTWGSVAESALTAWNANLTNLRFTVVRDSTAPIGRANDTNNVFWSRTIYGDAFDSRTLAIALTRYDPTTSRYSEADVIFNQNLNWDSYRGALQRHRAGVRCMTFAASPCMNSATPWA